jgi:thiosulfate reductase cytochrome b subunit
MKKINLHPLPLRIWHWANAFLVIFLIVTGIQLRIPGVASLPPQSTALLLHRYAGWAMAASWLFWLIYGLVGHHFSRHYRFRSRDFRGIFSQVSFYLVSIFRGEENPFRPSPDEKFNPLQKLAYGSIMGLFAPALVITGILFTDIPVFRKTILLWNAAGVINAIHVLAAYVFALYLVFHLYMATLGRTLSAHIKAMIVGYEEGPDESQGNGTPGIPETAAER